MDRRTHIASIGLPKIWATEASMKKLWPVSLALLVVFQLAAPR
jgi:hypothetical protein